MQQKKTSITKILIQESKNIALKQNISSAQNFQSQHVRTMA